MSMENTRRVLRDILLIDPFFMSSLKGVVVVVGVVA